MPHDWKLNTQCQPGWGSEELGLVEEMLLIVGEKTFKSPFQPIL